MVIREMDGDDHSDPPPMLRVLDVVTIVHTVVDTVRVAAFIKRILEPPRSRYTDSRSPYSGIYPAPGRREERMLVRRQEQEVRNRDPDDVLLRRISMNSPITLELITTGIGGVSAASAVVYLFKNPDKIGGWFPKLQTSWWKGRLEAEKARKALNELREAGTTMRELDG